MRLALIPPYENANIVQHTDYQLLLPQCLDNTRYRRAYQRVRRDGSYLILDNGAAEGVPVEPATLMEMADGMMVNEVVVPDVMHDAAATLEAALAFAAYSEPRYNFMGVVQGASYGECMDCIKGFSTLSYITTLGIPRHLLDISEDMRVTLVDHIRLKYGDRWQLHLLGMNRKYTNELISYGRAYRMWHVRGIDTSAPFIYAMKGIPLTSHGEVLERPEDYFVRSIDSMDTTYINLAIMKLWVSSHA